MNEQAGTYLYHAHYGMQREEGLNGMILVSVPSGQSEPFAYDFDRSMLLTDWYHKSAHEHATGLASIPFVWVNEPEVLLLPSFSTALLFRNIILYPTSQCYV